jgi:hypothetical protein
MKVKPEAATAILELLMMGGKTPETQPDHEHSTAITRI